MNDKAGGTGAKVNEDDSGKVKIFDDKEFKGKTKLYLLLL